MTMKWKTCLLWYRFKNLTTIPWWEILNRQNLVVYQDHNQISIDQTDESTLDGDSGAIVKFGYAFILPPPMMDYHSACNFVFVSIMHD